MDRHAGIAGASLRWFRSRLSAWFLRHQRDLPWRRTRDPYRIWVSEIMLQQTRAQAVIPYYRKFLERFPTLEALARAPESDVLACWSGLGYYSRARNLQRAARALAGNGAFPRDYDSIRALPGVGPYTAAAVASIAFDLPHPVLDGNVMRVLARLTNDASDIGSPQTRARFNHLAAELLDPDYPGRFNQALMELGATICVPRAPACQLCPVARHCQARRGGTAGQLPVKLRKLRPERLQATLVIARRRGRVLLWRRSRSSARMAGFWELPSPAQLPGLAIGHDFGHIRHTITHHHYTFSVVAGKVDVAPPGFRWFTLAQLAALPLSTAARKALHLAGCH